MGAGDVTENGHEAKSNIEDTMSHHLDSTRHITMAFGNSIDPSKAEKEEGELSPNGDFDESNIGEEIEADGDDEDSEYKDPDDHNDKSGSESGGDEFSREEQEDGDREHDDDIDSKSESGGDAGDGSFAS